MKKLVLMVALFASPAAAAEPPWVGYWAGEGQDCALAGEMADEMPIELSADAEFGMEYSCDFKSVIPLGVGQSWAIKRECLDAGFVEHWPVILMLTPQDELLMIDESGYVAPMKRCEKVPQ